MERRDGVSSISDVGDSALALPRRNAVVIDHRLGLLQTEASTASVDTE
jgi:hypothetical protein